MIRHLFERDDTYVSTYNRQEGEPLWKEGKAAFHHGAHPRQVEATAEWNLGRKHNFGWGFKFGRNGSESDIGLDLHAGRIAHLWLRLWSPWTKWARVRPHRPDQYDARHTGIVVLPDRKGGRYLSIEVEARSGHWSSTEPWYRHIDLTKTTILGRQNFETVPGAAGITHVPTPEGMYEATWTQVRSTTTYVRWPGTWIDAIRGPRRRSWTDLKIEGGIPIEGKGESSYDCGMDGLFGTSGDTVEQAVVNATKSVENGRARYGGPHNLTRPMTVAEASTGAR